MSLFPVMYLLMQSPLETYRWVQSTQCCTLSAELAYVKLKEKADFEKEEINELHIGNNMHTMLNNATFELLFRGALFGPDTIIIN